MPTTEIPEVPTPDQPARDTHRPYGPEEVRLLAEMMARPEVNGNLAAAVAVLKSEQPSTDWNYNRCYKLTQSNAYLKAYHPARNPDALVPSDADAVDRVPMLTPGEAQEAAALVAQEKKLSAHDWVALGLDESQAKRMLSMEAFARMPLKTMIDTTHGSMMFALGTLLQNFEDTARRIRDRDLPEELDKEGNPRPAIDVERDWHKVLLAYSQEIRAIKGQTDQGNLLLAKVAQMKGEGGGLKGRKGKPGFGAMTVNAQPGSRVAIMPQPPQ